MGGGNRSSSATQARWLAWQANVGPGAAGDQLTFGRVHFAFAIPLMLRVDRTDEIAAVWKQQRRGLGCTQETPNTQTRMVRNSTDPVAVARESVLCDHVR